MGRSEEAMCDNCPFAPAGKGADLARSLRPGRLAGIKRDLLRGATFFCHKTVEYDDDAWSEDGDHYYGTGRERECGGSVAWLRSLTLDPEPGR